MSERPNVLFVVADDLNAWVAPLGRHPDVRTPHIDALAAESTLFTHAYCTAPHCNPSRMSVFTGLRPGTTGIYHDEGLPERRELAPTLPERLREAGYTVFGAGKVFHGSYDYAGAAREHAPRARWRDSHNPRALWDEFHPCPDEPLPARRPLNGLAEPAAGGRELHWYSHFDWGVLPSRPDARLPDETVCERALEFLHRAHERPFFCAVGLYRPHLPWYVPRRFFELYPLEEVSLPPVPEDALAGVPELARRWAETPPDHERILRAGQWRHAVQGYLASVSFCDAMVGRLVEGLRASGRLEDTLLVLFGDNGFHLGEKLHWRKFTLWEEATRVPLLVRAPGGPARREARPVSLLDLFPTLAELCGLRAPEGLEGASLAPALAGRPLGEIPLPRSTWGPGNHSLRTPRHRYTRYVDGSEELYDHASDPYEWRNLAREPAQAELLRALRPELEPLLARERERGSGASA